MTTIQCPICFDTLEPRPVAPCFVCGFAPDELEHLTAGMHSYAVYRHLSGLEIQLCEICLADLGSYDPEWFGRPRSKPLESWEFNILHDIHDPQPGHDKWCPSCNHRLAFLRFVEALRRHRP